MSAKVKISKHDYYVGMVEKFASYVDTEEKIVGIYATQEDSLIANTSLALKKLRNTFKYKIQMVIK